MMYLDKMMKRSSEEKEREMKVKKHLKEKEEAMKWMEKSIREKERIVEEDNDVLKGKKDG